MLAIIMLFRITAIEFNVIYSKPARKLFWRTTTLSIFGLIPLSKDYWLIKHF